MRRGILLTAMLLVSQSCIADGIPDQSKDITRIANEIEVLYRAGIALHRDYNLAYDDQFMACVQKSRPLRARAQALKDEAKHLARAGYRMNLVLASGDVFQCVYCSDHAAKACDRVPDGLKAVRSGLASE